MAGVLKFDERPTMTKILFICTGNSFRSPVAEALTKKYKPELEVHSAGTHPAEIIAQNGKNLLNKEGALEKIKEHPEPVTREKIDESDKIIVMKDEHAKIIGDNFQIDSGKIEIWDIDDPINPDVRAEDSFRQIKQKVKQL